MSEEILSVGIDIGTSTTQLVFSTITIENIASSFSIPRITIVDKVVHYKSNIIFTPLLEDNKIDVKKIEEFLVTEYAKAGANKQDIQTGAVIITGETARRENAQEVLQTLSGFAGDFVVATAGPDLESIIAAKGAGLHTYSKEHSTTVINIDIGGGTSNLAFLNRGEVTDTGCLDIGGRLIKLDPLTKEITYISPKIKELIELKKFSVHVGDTVTVERLLPVIQEMVHLLEESVGIRPATPFFDTIVTHRGLQNVQEAKCISFTGGVADSIYNPVTGDPFIYGDIGVLLGKAIAQSDLMKHFTVVKPEETIRATVVGAGSHTTEISGSTITYTKDLFPLKNIPVLKLSEEEEQLDDDAFHELLKNKLNWFKFDGKQENVAIAFKGKRSPSFLEIQQISNRLLAGMEELIAQSFPLVIIPEEDFAKALGQSMKAQVFAKDDIICIDGIHVENGDYIDIGKPLAEGKVVPVVIKTLVFH
ncbi:ethanolamine ammonia-lyase reactivating factor EutA [Mesobacillus zeae]|uniref:Ethanolamine ammonia-lyase reactivating factor EutA n=1 Tax=Mesobacillus zeae TaxID=1917180 RepID=A0A398B8Z0_9BACI|nr:ethanolamine ammonia-lyase reactivating factor EutA [Mesobacillus zeae]RID86332.1 ethanolamine ammonia-lyase reactivating factor EutA [Mesobacillus zeae]